MPAEPIVAFGEFTARELAEARRIATEAVEKYGDFQTDAEWELFRKSGIWNDHVSVQAALKALHSPLAAQVEVERRREAEATIDAMIVSSVRYCIGRQSYIVGTCDGWLRSLWATLSRGTRAVIHNDIRTALEQERIGCRQLGMEIDRDTWAALYRDMSPGGSLAAEPVDV